MIMNHKNKIPSMFCSNKEIEKLLLLGTNDFSTLGIDT